MLVISPLSADTEKEILIKSDDVNNDVILNVLKAINARVKKFDRNHDIFYVAGYSQNGEKIYISTGTCRKLFDMAAGASLRIAF